MEKFSVRPGYKSEQLLVEFWGDHRGKNFPNIQKILAEGLKAKAKIHSESEIVTIARVTDEFISMWEYTNGVYELDDDIWAYFIHAPNNNAQVISDIERVLLASGKFVKQEVDFSEYR